MPMTNAGKGLAAGLVLSLMFFAFGGFFLAYSLRKWREGRRSAAWPSTSGVVTSSVAKQGRWNSRSGNWTVSSTVRYEYEVGGERFVSERVCFGAMFSDADQYARVAKYPKGQRVSVSYDPADPRSAVLEPGVQRGVFQGMAIGLVTTLIGCALLYAAFYTSR